jgi:hypothetical protein
MTEVIPTDRDKSSALIDGLGAFVFVFFFSVLFNLVYKNKAKIRSTRTYSYIPVPSLSPTLNG